MSTCLSITLFFLNLFSACRPGSLIVEFELLIDPSSPGYQTDIASALTGLVTKVTLVIGNQTIQAIKIDVNGQECEYLRWNCQSINY